MQATVDKLGIPLDLVVIADDSEYTDTRREWLRVREISESGAILLRPDHHVAWRCFENQDLSIKQKHLVGVLSRVLMRGCVINEPFDDLC